MLVRNLRQLFRKMKYVEPQSWVIQPQDAHRQVKYDDYEHLNPKIYRQIKKQYSRKRQDEALQPVSPHAGPITVEHPKIHDKIYRWCSCGQSLKQPWCDGSHLGTDFKPFKFTIEEKVKDLQLCGCKLTTQKPFCDGKSCKNLTNSESNISGNSSDNNS